jgi:hypothetical protein
VNIVSARAGARSFETPAGPGEDGAASATLDLEARQSKRTAVGLFQRADVRAHRDAIRCPPATAVTPHHHESRAVFRLGILPDDLDLRVRPLREQDRSLLRTVIEPKHLPGRDIFRAEPSDKVGLSRFGGDDGARQHECRLRHGCQLPRAWLPRQKRRNSDRCCRGHRWLTCLVVIETV